MNRNDFFSVFLFTQKIWIKTNLQKDFYFEWALQLKTETLLVTKLENIHKNTETTVNRVNMKVEENMLKEKNFSDFSFKVKPNNEN